MLLILLHVECLCIDPVKERVFREVEVIMVAPKRVGAENFALESEFECELEWIFWYQLEYQ